MDQKLGKQANGKQSDACNPTFQKVNFSAHKQWRKQLRRIFRTICIIMKQWKQSHKFI